MITIASRRWRRLVAVYGGIHSQTCYGADLLEAIEQHEGLLPCTILRPVPGEERTHGRRLAGSFVSVHAVRLVSCTLDFTLPLILSSPLTHKSASNLTWWHLVTTCKAARQLLTKVTRLRFGFRYF